jgi:hypothetical protein
MYADRPSDNSHPLTDWLTSERRANAIRHSINGTCWLLVLVGSIWLLAGLEHLHWLPVELRRSYYSTPPYDLVIHTDALHRYLMAVVCFWMAGVLHCLHRIVVRLLR